MNRRMLVVALFSLVAGAGGIAVASLAGCSGSGCMMGPDCKMGDMGGSSHCAPKGTDAAQPAPAQPAAGDSAQKPGSAMVNARCPIMGGKPTAALTRDYNGQKVGFCCAMCPGQWDKLTNAQKDAKLAKVTAAAN